MTYPEEYGVIEETLAPDGDELDVICLTIQPTFSGLYVPIRIIGVLEMIDGGEQDNKLLAVNASEPRLNHIQELKDAKDIYWGVTVPGILKFDRESIGTPGSPAKKFPVIAIARPENTIDCWFFRRPGGPDCSAADIDGVVLLFVYSTL